MRVVAVWLSKDSTKVHPHRPIGIKLMF